MVSKLNLDDYHIQELLDAVNTLDIEEVYYVLFKNNDYEFYLNREKVIYYILIIIEDKIEDYFANNKLNKVNELLKMRKDLIIYYLKNFNNKFYSRFEFLTDDKDYDKLINYIRSN